MIAIPAVDLRDGACVQLVGGSYDAERVRLPDPVAVARRWRDAGFTSLHVVDLDAATERGSNAGLMDRILATGGIDTQVGGGIRSEATIAAYLSAGAQRVVIGTRALEDPAWLAAQAARWPGRIVAALDVRDSTPQTRGWAADSTRSLDEAVDALVGAPLAGVLVTAVHAEGRMAGVDVALCERVTARSALPLIASGGVGSFDDLERLRDAGAWGVVIGMALYTGALDVDQVARTFGRGT